jgi:hypothetical protein
MASQKQLDANRANAQRCTGPKTPAGKAASSLNALKHGLTAQIAVIPGENAALFGRTLRSFLDDLQPAGPLETVLVHQIVMASWRLTRLRSLESGLFDLRVADEAHNVEQEYETLAQKTRLAYAFYKDCAGRDAFTTLARYESRAERAVYRALHELHRLRAARSASPTSPPAETEICRTKPIPGPKSSIPPIPPSPNPLDLSQASGS